MAQFWSEPSTSVGGLWSRPAQRQADTGGAHLADATMLFAPKSGGVKRYLLAKQAWMVRNRPSVRHTLVVPGKTSGWADDGLMRIASAPLPFGDGYRWPASVRKWTKRLVDLGPDIIEAGDPYGPGHAALEAGEELGVPVIGFCHSDPAALAALHFGEWAEKPVFRAWSTFFKRFDHVVAPSRHIAERLDEAGVTRVTTQHLGVDTDVFHPEDRDADRIRRELGLKPSTRLLVFAGRPAKEKNVDVLLAAAARLGDPYHLLLIGAGKDQPPQANATYLDYVREPKTLTRLISSCDAFVHANAQEPFGLVIIEAMACGLPVVGMSSGGAAELVDATVGQPARAPTESAVAEAVTALFERDLDTLGRAARRRAVERHSWDYAFSGLSALYASLTGAAAFLGHDRDALLN
jgi:alpha-1,6-mannosyltransferase